MLYEGVTGVSLSHSLNPTSLTNLEFGADAVGCCHVLSILPVGSPSMFSERPHVQLHRVNHE